MRTSSLALALFLVAICLAQSGHALSAPVGADRKLKVYISVDMEGVAGVVSDGQLGPEGFEYGRFREFVTAEANAATAQVLADAPSPRGGAWSRDNVIVFAPNIEDGLYRVPATGGQVTPVTRLDREASRTPTDGPGFFPTDVRCFSLRAHRNLKSRACTQLRWIVKKTGS